jgi:hypothetical protein
MRLDQQIFPILFRICFFENMDNLKMTGSIIISILSQEPTFSSFRKYLELILSILIKNY